MDKYLYLEGIRDVNARLFYALMIRHTDELLPIVYTPTVGQACLSFSHIFMPRWVRGSVDRSIHLHVCVCSPAQTDSTNRSLHPPTHGQHTTPTAPRASSSP